MPLSPAMQVDQFKVIRRLGAGATAEVWLARDTQLGRRVALKVITSEVLCTPEARERFLHEARITARFSHPHIVTIYAVGEVDGRAYLALEYLEGDTLRDRIPAAPREVLRWSLAVADALAEAHGKGLVHRDLKPDNVVIATDGRLRLLDFGLAGAAGTGGVDAGGTLRGTPRYMAPELWLGHSPSPAVDVWAFGVIVYELIIGHPPFHDDDPYRLAELVTDPHIRAPLLPDDPAGLADLVDRCLSPVAARRPTAVELVDTLGALLGRHPLQASPFRGLDAFDEADAPLFFGRDVELGTFVERLRTHAFLPIIGPSGAGKSSFVAAGVVPRLRERGPLVVLSMRPGRAPLATLAGLLTRTGSELACGAAPMERDELLRAPARLGLQLRDLAGRLQTSVLLVVDQLEEVVTLTADPDERRAFVAAMVKAADDPLAPVRVVTTLREEFLGRVILTEEARSAFSQISVLRTPGPEALREIVVRPVEVVRHSFDDPSLPDDMVAEVADAPAGLPLLQFAGQQLWLRRDRDRRVLRRADYEAIGGVAGALARHADGVLARMTPRQVQHARDMLLRLVTDEGTRQTQARPELLAGLDPGADTVLDALIDARLLVARDDEQRGGPVVIELIHESLATTWTRLAHWVEASREDLAFLAEVRAAADVWQRRGRPRDEVWSEPAVAEAAHHLDKLHTVPLEVRQFLDAGMRRARWRRARRVWLVTAVVIATLAVVALLWWQRGQAVAQREVARSEQARALLAQAETALDARRGREARSALRASLEIDDGVAARAAWWRALHEPLEWERVLGVQNLDVAISPDGATVAMASDDAVVLTDSATGAVIRVLDDHEPRGAGRLVFSRDGGTLARVNHSPIVTLWDTRTGAVRKRVWHTEPLRLEPHAHRNPIQEARHDGKLVFIDTVSNAIVGEAGGLGAGHTTDAALVFATARARGYAVADGHTGEPTAQVTAPDGRRSRPTVHADGLAAVVDGQWLEWASFDGTVRRTHSGRELARHPVVRGAGHVTALSRQGELVDWHASEPAPTVGRLPGDEPAVRAETDLQGRVWVGGQRGTLVRLRADGLQSDWQVAAHDGAVRGLGASSTRAASMDSRGTVRLWNTELDAPTRDSGLTQVVRHAAFSSTGDLLATAGNDSVVTLWHVPSGRVLRRLDHGATATRGLDISDDGRWLATSHPDRRIRLFDLRHRHPPHHDHRRGPAPAVRSLLHPARGGERGSPRPVLGAWRSRAGRPAPRARAAVLVRLEPRRSLAGCVWGRALGRRVGRAVRRPGPRVVGLPPLRLVAGVVPGGRARVRGRSAHRVAVPGVRRRLRRGRRARGRLLVGGRAGRRPEVLRGIRAGSLGPHDRRGGFARLCWSLPAQPLGPGPTTPAGPCSPTPVDPGFACTTPRPCDRAGAPRPCGPPGSSPGRTRAGVDRSPSTPLPPSTTPPCCGEAADPPCAA